MQKKFILFFSQGFFLPRFGRESLWNAEMANDMCCPHEQGMLGKTWWLTRQGAALWFAEDGDVGTKANSDHEFKARYLIV